jgi:hypothetical protein
LAVALVTERDWMISISYAHRAEAVRETRIAPAAARNGYA